MRVVTVSKSQKHFFLKLHCPKSKRNFLKTFVISWPLKLIQFAFFQLSASLRWKFHNLKWYFIFVYRFTIMCFTTKSGQKWRRSAKLRSTHQGPLYFNRCRFVHHIWILSSLVQVVEQFRAGVWVCWKAPLVWVRTRLQPMWKRDFRQVQKPQ